MRISRVIITGDFLRPLEADQNQSESVRRIRWFEDLLSPPLSLVTDLPVKRLACEGRVTMRSLYADCRLTPSLDAWAAIYADRLSDDLRDRILEWCQDALVIGIE